MRVVRLAAASALLFGACLLPKYQVVEDGGAAGGGASGRGGSSAGSAGRGGAGGAAGGTAGSTGGTAGSIGPTGGTGGVATGGTGGSAGAAGTTSGSAGHGGTTGTAGVNGSAGRGGTTGMAGTGGVTGSAGRGGTTGAAGMGGTTGSAGRGGTTGTAGTGGGGAGRGGTTGGGGSTVAPDWLSSIAVVYQFDQPQQGQLGVEAHGNNALHLEEQGVFLPTSDTTNFIEGASVKMPGNLNTSTYFQTATGAGLPSVFKTEATNSWTTGGWFRITNTTDQQWLIHTEGPTTFEQGGFYFYVNQAAGKLSSRTASAYCRLGVKESTGNYKEVSADGTVGFDPVAGNNWVHLTCRYNATTNELSILVGGVTQASNIDVTHQVASGPGPFMIGCNESWGCSLTGNADEVFFATSALSDVDVHRIYACGIDGSRCRCNGAAYTNCGFLQSASCPMLPACNAAVP
jgi:hypothetical protein